MKKGWPTEKASCRVGVLAPVLAHSVDKQIEFSKRRSTLRIRVLALFFVVLVALSSLAQTTSSAPQSAPTASASDSTKPADPQPLPMPSMAGPLQTAVPR